MEKIVLTNRACPLASAELYLFGAHVTKWVDKAGVDRLFLSSKAKLDGSKAIRGGIPICFPQFGTMGPLQQHGFARTSLWKRIDSPPTSDPSSKATLGLQASEKSLGLYPHQFHATLEVELTDLGDCLLTVSVRNVAKSGPLAFTIALHAYFNVDDSATATISGLDGVNYIDQLDDNKTSNQSADVSFQSEVDRIYLSTPNRLVVDGGPTMRTSVTKASLDDTVVWNPHVEKAKSMADMDDDEWRRFVCLEPAAVQSPISLGAEQTWKATLLLQ